MSPGADRERRLLAVEQVSGVRVVGHLQDTPTGREIEASRQERNQSRFWWALHRVDVMFKGRRPADRDPPRPADGHLPR